MNKSNPLLIRAWGVRGEGYSSSPGVSRYGGNTSCVEIQCGENVMIFDGGSGLKLLGEELCRRGQRKAHLFLSHFHYDHVSGIPFFAPFYRSDCRVDIWSGNLPGRNATRDAIHDYMRAPFFPVGPEVFKADIRYHDFRPGDTIRPAESISMRTCALSHPGGGCGYRVDYEGKSICYVTDTGHVPEKPDDTILGLIDGADFVIYDAAYTDLEFPEFAHFGHSTWEEGVRLCKIAGARRLAVFHHRQSRTDDELDQIGKKVEALLPGSFVMREGETVEL